MFFTFNHTTNEDFTLSADFAHFIENNGILFIQVGENKSLFGGFMAKCNDDGYHIPP